MTTPTPLPPSTPATGFILGDNLYNKGKWAVMILLPAISTLYFTLGKIWGLPSVEQVVGSIAALTAFLGVVIGVSSKTYKSSDAQYDGQMNILDDGTGKTTYQFDVGSNLDKLGSMKNLNIKVNSDVISNPVPPVEPPIPPV